MLTWSEVPDPTPPGPDEVLVEVAASAVNRADLLQRAGFYPPPPGAPPYPGLECSGRIAAVGSSVTDWTVGDEVCALLGGGGYAQWVTVPAAHCLPVPSGVSLEDAAALPEVACTVWSNVFDLGRLQPLDTILIHGGGSGIGTFAIQLAAERGARVITTARAAKHETLQDLGAEITIDYTSEDFAAAVRTATGNRGADVILDIMGASYLERNIAVAGHRRPPGHHRAAGRAHGRDRPRRPAGEARQHHRHRPAVPPPRREGGHRRSRPRARLATDRERAGTAGDPHPAAHGGGRGGPPPRGVV